MTDRDERPKTPEKFGMPERIEQVRANFQGLRDIYDAQSEDGDYSFLFDSEQFKDLTPEEQAEIRKEFSKDGPVAQEQPEQAVAQETASPHFEDIYTLMESMGESAYAALSTTPDFLTLTEDEQEKLRVEFGGEGQATAARTTEHPEPTLETRDTRETRPKKRKFSAYNVQTDEESGQAHVTEDYQDWDRRRQEYRTRKNVPTGITVPDALVTDMSTDASLQERFTSFCGKIREELDERGVKLFFDPSKTEGGDKVPKWKFFLNGRPIEHYLTLADLPSEISAMVREDSAYFNKPEYKRWFGKSMQQKREQIISDLAAEHFSTMGEDSSEVAVEEQEQPVPTIAEHGTSVPEDTDGPSIERAPKLVPNEVMERAEGVTQVLREQFAALAKNEDDKKEIERHVQEAAAKLLAERYVKEGFPVAAEDILDILNGTVSDETTGVYDAARAVFAEHLASSFESSRSDNERARAVLELMRNSRSGDPAVDAPSSRVLEDIAAGKYDDDGKAALEKAVFIDAHSSLPLERTESVGKGARLELDEKYPLSRAVEDAVKDAVSVLAGSARSDNHDIIVSKLGAKLARMVEAKPDNKLLVYDKKDQHLTVKDLGTFSKDMQVMYRKLTEHEV